MADRYRGTMYIGVIADLPGRIHQHRTGEGSDFCKRYGLHRLVWAEHTPSITDAIAQEKRTAAAKRSPATRSCSRSSPGRALARRDLRRETSSTTWTGPSPSGGCRPGG